MSYVLTRLWERYKKWQLSPAGFESVTTAVTRSSVTRRLWSCAETARSFVKNHRQSNIPAKKCASEGNALSSSFRSIAMCILSHKTLLLIAFVTANNDSDAKMRPNWQISVAGSTEHCNYAKHTFVLHTLCATAQLNNFIFVFIKIILSCQQLSMFRSLLIISGRLLNGVR